MTVTAMLIGDPSINPGSAIYMVEASSIVRAAHESGL